MLGAIQTAIIYVVTFLPLAFLDAIARVWPGIGPH